MKARIQQEPRCVLLWQVAPAVPSTPRWNTLHAEPPESPPFDRRRPGHHHGSPLHRAGTLGGEAAPAPDVPERPAMIVSGLRHDNGDLGQFVDEVRRGGAVIPLRAMVTPTSRSWTLAALLAELNREHEHVGGQA